MSSNYPPGVYGNEYQINGADVETTRFLFCDVCDTETEAAPAEITGSVVTAWCPECEAEFDWEISEEYDD